MITKQMIDDCKRDLPPVRVRFNGKTHWARVSGRLNKFATVSVTNYGTLHSGSGLFWDAQFSWEAVCRAVTSGVPLRG
jgi:hypothetical protein